jgi:hypothetical protein
LLSKTTPTEPISSRMPLCPMERPNNASDFSCAPRPAPLPVYQPIRDGGVSSDQVSVTTASLRYAALTIAVLTRRDCASRLYTHHTSGKRSTRSNYTGSEIVMTRACDRHGSDVIAQRKESTLTRTLSRPLECASSCDVAQQRLRGIVPNTGDIASPRGRLLRPRPAVPQKGARHGPA